MNDEENANGPAGDSPSGEAEPVTQGAVTPAKPAKKQAKRKPKPKAEVKPASEPSVAVRKAAIFHHMDVATFLTLHTEAEAEQIVAQRGCLVRH